jgi:hypothetical protein
MPDLLTGTIGRLRREFPQIPRRDLTAVVRRCRADIDTGAPPDCIPELVERIARVRLTELAASGSRSGLASVDHPPTRQLAFSA